MSEIGKKPELKDRASTATNEHGGRYSLLEIFRLLLLILSPGIDQRKRPGWWERMVPVAHVLTAVFTLVLAVFAIAAWIEARHGTRALEGQLETMQYDERPWVGAEYAADRAQPGQDVLVRIIVRNGGKSPALNVAAHFARVRLPDNADYKATELMKCPNTECSRELLLPGASSFYGILIPAADTLKSMEAGEYFLVRGRIDYDDGLGKSWWTQTCWYYDKVLFSVAACREGVVSRVVV